MVLVNAGTASAAEIVASALQANGRALVIGDRTFGKGSVQTLFSPLLQDDYYIKLTVAQYRSPAGRLFSQGVIPDLAVPPVKGGKMPLGFREENLSGSLPPPEAPPAQSELVTRVASCVAATKPAADWQLASAALDCLAAAAP